MWRAGSFIVAGASLLALMFGTEKPAYGSPTAGEGETERSIGSSLKHYSNYPSIYQIDRTPTSSRPRRFIQNERINPANLIELISGDMETRSERDESIKRETTCRHFSPLFYDCVFYSDCRWFGDQTAACGQIVYSPTLRQVELSINPALCRNESESLKATSFNAPSVPRKINCWDGTYRERVKWNILRDNMASGQKSTMLV
jgi:hypothetical protein